MSSFSKGRAELAAFRFVTLLLLVLVCWGKADAQTPGPSADVIPGNLWKLAKPGGDTVIIPNLFGWPFAGSAVTYPQNDAPSGTAVELYAAPHYFPAAGAPPTGQVLLTVLLKFRNASTVHFSGNLQFAMNVPTSYPSMPGIVYAFTYDSGASPRWSTTGIQGIIAGPLQGSGASAYQPMTFVVPYPVLSSTHYVNFAFVSVPSWTGDFAGFPGSTWQQQWNNAHVDDVFAGTMPVSDATLPSGGQALDVHYAAHSSGFNCPDCGGAQGGIQFKAYAPSLSNASAVYLKYYIKFPVGFDWGLEGKLPGLLGGSTWWARLEWHSAKGTVHCPGSTCGGGLVITNPCTTSEIDVGRGTWSFSADGKWHSVKEYVNTAGNGTVTVWYDGTQAVTTTLACTNNGTVGGIIFQTFYGGNATKWGPSVPTDVYFGGVETSTSPI
jgi:hypothetical protein